jgi:hypothetical protein
MRARRLVVLLIAYLVLDLADAVLPGAFSFEVSDSKIEEAVHVQRCSDNKVALPVGAAPPDRRVEPRDDSFIRRRPVLTEPPLRDVAWRRPALPEARQAPAQSLDDH